MTKPEVRITTGRGGPDYKHGSFVEITGPMHDWIRVGFYTEKRDAEVAKYAIESAIEVAVAFGISSLRRGTYRRCRHGRCIPWTGYCD